MLIVKKLGMVSVCFFHAMCRWAMITLPGTTSYTTPSQPSLVQHEAFISIFYVIDLRSHLAIFTPVIFRLDLLVKLLILSGGFVLDDVSN